MEYESLIISLIYLFRLVDTSHGLFVLTEGNWRGALVACVVLASKMWDDYHIDNASYCDILPGLTLERLNELESGYLKAVQFQLFVSPREYATVHYTLQAMITKEEIRRVGHGSSFTTTTQDHTKPSESQSSKNLEDLVPLVDQTPDTSPTSPSEQLTRVDDLYNCDPVADSLEIMRLHLDSASITAMERDITESVIEYDQKKCRKTVHIAPIPEGRTDDAATNSAMTTSCLYMPHLYICGAIVGDAKSKYYL
jgi:hypothetical protein